MNPHDRKKIIMMSENVKSISFIFLIISNYHLLWIWIWNNKKEYSFTFLKILSKDYIEKEIKIE